MESQATRRRDYESRRMAILSAFLNHPKNVHKAYAFAWYHRLSPVLIAPYDEAFNDEHCVTAATVDRVLFLVEKLTAAKQWDSLTLEKISKRLGFQSTEVPELVLDFLALADKIDKTALSALQEPSDVGYTLSTFSAFEDFTPEDISLPS